MKKLLFISLLLVGLANAKNPEKGDIWSFSSGNPFEKHTYPSIITDVKVGTGGHMWVKYLTREEGGKWVHEFHEPQGLFLMVNTYQRKATHQDSVFFELDKSVCTWLKKLI